MLTRRPRGTRDHLPDDLAAWHHLERVASDLCARYGFGEIRTPLLEHTELFLRGVGEGTDIVDKEMYTFTDRGGRSLTLRPESTVPVMRAFLEAGMHNRALPVKLFYLNYPCFRYERPQAVRYRQHYQFGVEVIGSPDPLVDVEVISLAVEYLEILGLEGFELRLNSIGCQDCRRAYTDKLRRYLHDRDDDLCPTCRDRRDRNPLRVLDCKDESCRTTVVAGAPLLVDRLCEGCRHHLSRVREGLESLGLAHDLDPRLVRGLDYYTHTVFEIYYRGSAAQDALCGGGRYDGLASVLEGPDTPGMGFGMGCERLLLALEESGHIAPAAPGPDVFLVAVGDRARDRRLLLLRDVRRAGLSADTDFMDRSMKAQLRLAGRRGAAVALIVGDDEIAAGTAQARVLATGDQVEISLASAGAAVANLLGRAPNEGGARS